MMQFCPCWATNARLWVTQRRQAHVGTSRINIRASFQLRSNPPEALGHSRSIIDMRRVSTMWRFTSIAAPRWTTSIPNSWSSVQRFLNRQQSTPTHLAIMRYPYEIPMGWCWSLSMNHNSEVSSNIRVETTLYPLAPWAGHSAAI